MIKNHVTNFKFSKRLKDLGVKQQSLFYWGYEEEAKEYTVKFLHLAIPHYSAFLATELIEMMPSIFYKDETIELYSSVGDACLPKTHTIPHRYYLKLSKFYEYWNCDAVGTGHDTYGQAICSLSFGETDKNPSNACAKMLIELIENKIVEI